MKMGNNNAKDSIPQTPSDDNNNTVIDTDSCKHRPFILRKLFKIEDASFKGETTDMYGNVSQTMSELGNSQSTRKVH